MVLDEVQQLSTPIERRGPVRRIGATQVVAWGERFGLLVIFAGVVLAFGVIPSTRATFLTHANLSVVVGSQSVLAIIAVGAMIPLVCGEFDLSAGSNAGLCSIVSASYLSHAGANLVLGIALAMVVGAAVGLANGLIVVCLRVTSLIATLGTATLISGVVTQYTAGVSITGVPASLARFGAGDTLGLPNTLWVVFGVGAATIYLLEFTPFGRYVRSIGSNRRAAVLVGLRVRQITLLTYVASGLFAGAAGALLVARLGGANPSTGFDYTLPALGAVFLGATTIRPGRFNTLGTLVAIFFLAALSSGLSLYGAPSYVQSYINGAALIVGVGVSAMFAAQRQRGAT
jgi:ribose transport system permease protein